MPDIHDEDDKKKETEFSLNEKEADSEDRFDSSRNLRDIKIDEIDLKTPVSINNILLDAPQSTQEIVEVPENPKEEPKIEEPTQQEPSPAPQVVEEKSEETIPRHKVGPPPKKVFEKPSHGPGAAPKRPIFKARPQVVPKLLGEEEVKKEPEIELDRHDIIHTADPVPQAPHEEPLPEQKDEMTAKKIHPATISLPAEDRDEKQPSKKESDEEDLDVEIDWGARKAKTDAIPMTTQMDSPTFGISIRKSKPLAKVLTFGENELKEVYPDKDIDEKEENTTIDIDPPVKKVFGKTLFKKQTAEPVIPIPEIAVQESKEETQPPETVISNSSTQEIEEKPEIKKPPVKKLFKQTKVVKKT